MVSPLYRNERPGELPDSWYVASARLPAERPSLKGHHQADVCIIGAGFTGLSTGWELAQKGLDVIIVDAHRVGFGASGRNGGQVWSGYNTPQRKLAKTYGADHAKDLWAITQEAKARVRAICDAHVPDARFRPGIAEAATKPAEVAEMHRDAAFLQDSYGYAEITALDRNQIQDIIRTEDYYGGHLDTCAGHIHPLRFVVGLADLAEGAGARIFERTEAHHISDGDPAIVRCPQGQIRARHVILAGNGYLPNLRRAVTAKVLPVNSFIAATEPLGERASEILTRDIAVSDSKFVNSYYRLSEDKRLLFGGRAAYGIGFPKTLHQEMQARIAATFPQIGKVRIDYAWGGTLGVTATRLPAIQRLAPNVVSAGGYSGVGVALSGMAGKILAEAIAGQAGRFDTLANLRVPTYPGGTLFRSPIRHLAMTWFSLRDRLGV
ncbi:NAD(P)/FAD-dependent oxidoreductase [Yoonia litorea]|uniref:Gamma-glutamylputrescine oxidase n=1 Tax=Yoonia litorea TaxID=1123755 RepID=A0A1I6MH92_9RHOB|nr:FAD-binding oxidoreductase [Yoonia litorea]SFS14977.1 gamma-glutamylputrescine oxidase [Yoonia litorea]